MIGMKIFPFVKRIQVLTSQDVLERIDNVYNFESVYYF